MRRREDFDPEDPGGGHGDDGREARPAPSSGIGPRHILIGLLVVLLVVFAIVNFEPVKVDFVLFESDARIVTVIAVAGGLGFVIGWLVGRPSRKERRLLRRRDLDD